MIMDNHTLAKLRRDFHLNLYEVKIWTALLSRGISTAGELSDIAEVPRSRAYDVLESLEKKGFVVMKLGKPIKYIAMPPEEVIDRVKKIVAATAVKKAMRLEELKGTGTLVELGELYTKGIEYIDPTEFAGAVRGQDNVYNQLETMIKGAKGKILITTSDAGLVRKVEGMEKALREARGRGVRVKIAAPLTKENKEALSKIKDIADVKTVKKLNARFAVIDGREALLMLKGDKEVHPNYDVAVWLNSDLFASALDTMFETIWKGK
jgi:sugar-specific transcriptional regulator TrmB